METDKTKIVISTLVAGIVGIIGFLLLIRSTFKLEDVFANEVVQEIPESVERESLSVKGESSSPKNVNKNLEVSWNRENSLEVNSISSKNPPYILVQDNDINFISEIIVNDFLEVRYFIPKDASNISLYDRDLISFIREEQNNYYLILKEGSISEPIRINIDKIEEIIDTYYYNQSFYLDIKVDGYYYLYWLNLRDKSLTQMTNLSSFKDSFEFIKANENSLEFISMDKCFSFFFYNKRIVEGECIKEEPVLNEIKIGINTFEVEKSIKAADRTFYLIRNEENKSELVSKVNSEEQFLRTNIDVPFSFIDEFFEYKGSVFVLSLNELYYFDYLNFEWREIEFENAEVNDISLINNKSLNN